MKRNLRKGRARCLCGLRVTLHFTTDNRKLDCAEARRMHPRATRSCAPFADLLQSAAVDRALKLWAKK